MIRESTIERKTLETDIVLSIALDGMGRGDIRTTVPFLDHMLMLLAKHSKLDMTIAASGDTDVDDHHLVEDVGICLGDALKEALGDKRGIQRYGSWQLPMDETLMEVALDISGRPCFVYHVEAEQKMLKSFDTHLVEEFFKALVLRLGCALHINLRYGKNAHHIYEAVFKCFALVLRQAVSVVGDEIPSSKGTID